PQALRGAARLREPGEARDPRFPLAVPAPRADTAPDRAHGGRRARPGAADRLLRRGLPRGDAPLPAVRARGPPARDLDRGRAGRRPVARGHRAPVRAYAVTEATLTRCPVSQARRAAIPTRKAAIPSSIVTGAGRPRSTFWAKLRSWAV